MRHLPRLRAFVRLRAGPTVRAHDDSGDLVQSVCREVLAKLPDAHFDGEAAFRSWLFAEAARKILKRARFNTAAKRDDVRAEAFDSELVACYSSFASPSQHAAVREQLEQVEAAFDHLSERERELISLAYLVETPRADIAQQLGLSEGALRTALHRALARLASLLDRPGRGES